MAKKTVIRLRDSEGRARQLGHIADGTFFAFKRREDRHLYLGGASSVRDAVHGKTAAWGLDFIILSKLREKYGITKVVIPTSNTVYSTTMEKLFGPDGFVKQFGGQRKQVFLSIHHWEREKA